MVLPFDDGGCSSFFTPVANESQANSERCRFPFLVSRFPLHRTPPVAPVDIWQSQLETVAHGVATQCIDRIKAHGLIVEERHVVLDGVIVPEPGGLICEQSERGGMRLGESELAKGNHLAKHFLGGGFGDAAGEGAGAKLLPETG